MDDGRLLALLAVLGVAGAGVAGSRGRFIGVQSAHSGWTIYRVDDDGGITFAGKAKSPRTRRGSTR